MLYAHHLMEVVSSATEVYVIITCSYQVSGVHCIVTECLVGWFVSVQYFYEV